MALEYSAVFEPDDALALGIHPLETVMRLIIITAGESEYDAQVITYIKVSSYTNYSLVGAAHANPTTTESSLR